MEKPTSSRVITPHIIKYGVQYHLAGISALDFTETLLKGIQISLRVNELSIAKAAII
jgi:hypothetical protein